MAANSASLSLTDYSLAQFDAQQGDVTLVFGEGDNEQTLMAHSFFLSRAEYFASALKTSFQEGQTRKVKLPDVSPVLMKPLIRVLYTDSIDLLKSDLENAAFPSDQLFSLCKLADRFLVPDVASHGAYDIYAEFIVSKDRGCREYVDIFVQLVGMRIPESALTVLLQGFRVAVENSECTAEDILPLIAEARLKEVFTQCRSLLTSLLKSKIDFGTNVALCAVLAAKHGLMDLVEAVLDVITFDSNGLSAALFNGWAAREHDNLCRETELLSKQLRQHLRLRFAAKTLPCLMAAFRNSVLGRHDRGIARLLSTDDHSTIAAKLSKDIEEITADMFPTTSNVIQEEGQPSRPEKRRKLA